MITLPIPLLLFSCAASAAVGAVLVTLVYVVIIAIEIKQHPV